MRSDASGGLHKFLEDAGKLKFEKALLAAKIDSVETIRQSNLEELSKAVPKSIARIMKKLAGEAVDSKRDNDNDLVEFLAVMKKEKFHGKLAAANIKSVEDLCRLSVEEIAAAGVAKSIARLLKKKAVEAKGAHDHHKKDEVNDPPTVTAMKVEDIAEIRNIWTALKASRSSFGKEFYVKLLETDAHIRSVFEGVSLDLLGNDFDEAMNVFMLCLDTPAKFLPLRDSFIARLVRYGIPARSLWLGSDAFVFAVSSVSPQSVLKCNLSCWTQFFRFLIPPFHPTVLRSVHVPSETSCNKAMEEIVPRIVHDLKLSGRLFSSHWLVDHPQFFRCLWECIGALNSWKKETGSWTLLVKACDVLVSSSRSLSMDQDRKLLCVDLPTVVKGLVSDEAEAQSWEYAFQIVAGATIGIDKVIDSVREGHLDKVQESWNLVYGRAREPFSELFYEDFQKDPAVARVFKNTQLAMQRQRFVHQFNAIIMRLNESMELVLRPLLLELGTRHRLHYLVGLNEMLSVNKSVVVSLKEMLGTVHWTHELESAWGYALGVISAYMITGWTCGTTALIDYSKPVVVQWEQSSQVTNGMSDWGTINMLALRQLRDKAGALFLEFFDSFAKKVGQSQSPHLAAHRYATVVNKTLDEEDVAVSKERLTSMGRRHIRHHGVTVESLTSAGQDWMSVAKETFGPMLTCDVAIEWARLWCIIATSMSPSYVECGLSAHKLAATVAQQVEPQRVSVKKKLSSLRLAKRVSLPGNVVRLLFDCSPPLKFRAGQYAKIRWTLPNGKARTRFYSIASCPDPKRGTADELELCVREVSGGAVSPFIYGELAPNDTADLVLAAGHFVLPDPLKIVNRLMISGGIGIVAFAGVIRYAAALCREGLLERKVSLELIHCNRLLPFPFMDELLDLRNEFHGGDMFTFRLVLCITKGEEDDVRQFRAENPGVDLYDERPTLEIVKAALGRFQGSTVAGPETYMCGPGSFQKAIQALLVHGCGHPKKRLHQEFFDL